MNQQYPISWYRSLHFQGIFSLGAIVGWFILGIILVMNTWGKTRFVEEAEYSIEQIGNNAVAELNQRTQEIAALTRTLATTSQELPKSAATFQTVIPSLLEFDGDLDVAGGGIWPEPYRFDPEQERRSFFWGRNTQEKLEYYDGYNVEETGYHNEAWYVVASHLKPGVCAWSESYIDPYSSQPMVTCSVAIFKTDQVENTPKNQWNIPIRTQLESQNITDLNLAETEQYLNRRESFFIMGRRSRVIAKSTEFDADNPDSNPNQTTSQASALQNPLFGVATVDLKLGGLINWVKMWQERVGGYIFILDRNNRFITFPDTDLVHHENNKNSDTNNTSLSQPAFLMLAQDLALAKQSFAPIANAVESINQRILEQVQGLPDYRSEVAVKLVEESEQLQQKDAELLAAILFDPLGRELNQSQLLQMVKLDRDFILQEPATAFIFHVPDAYWKLVIVKPTSEIAAVANRLIEILLSYAILTALIAAPLGYFILKRFVLNPLSKTTQAIEEMGQAIQSQKWESLEHVHVKFPVKNELGLLANVFNTLATTTLDQQRTLQSKNQELQCSFQQLKETQSQLVQAEKMSSLGQLVAGVAHEINNPVNFIHGNLVLAREYIDGLLELGNLAVSNASATEIQTKEEEIDLEFLRHDLPKLLGSMKTGTERIRTIVLSLKNFSRLDEAEYKTADLHEGIDSTLTILGNRLKYRHDSPGIEVVKEYGDLPMVKCYPGPLNQVFMNLLTNAIDALEDEQHKFTHPAQTDQKEHKWIRIKTETIEDNRVCITIADNGPGMSAEIKNRIFEYLFTTKPAGKGTGLGLTISRDIIEGKHQGRLYFESESGQGTTFFLEIPIKPQD